jgi:hypothetical protein
MRLPRFALFVLGIMNLAIGSFSATAYDSLEENYAKWKANRPGRYVYIYRTFCFCTYAPLRIEARGDSVIAVSPNLTSDDSTQSASNAQYYSPDSIFARIKIELDAKPFRTEIRYHAQLGYPERAYFDYSANVADDEHSYGMYDFKDRATTALPPPASASAPVPLSSAPARDLMGRTLIHPGVGAIFRFPR